MPSGRPARRSARGGRGGPIGRAAWPGAILASAALHVLGALAYVLFGLGAPPASPPASLVSTDPPAITVEILADPKAGTALGTEMAETAPVAETSAETPTGPPAELPAEPAPEPQTTAEPAPPARTPPPRPPAAAKPTATPLPPARTAAGATEEGREEGTTDIVLGDHVVPPGEDPTAHNIPPRYPPEAVRRGQQGTVQLKVLVATDGTALSVEVAVSSGYPLLDRAARDAVAKWRFRPGKQDGLAMPATLPASLTFSLVEQ